MTVVRAATFVVPETVAVPTVNACAVVAAATTAVAFVAAAPTATARVTPVGVTRAAPLNPAFGVDEASVTDANAAMLWVVAVTVPAAAVALTASGPVVAVAVVVGV